MKVLILAFLMVPCVCLGARMEVLWTNSFRKELHVNCAVEDPLCNQVCSSSGVCYLEEGTCRNCIGTSLQMHHIFSEIGRSIHRQHTISILEVAGFLKQGDFVTFMAQDVFNIIDAHNAVSVYRRFESLCPGESIHQILFLRTEQITRKLIAPEFVYCEYDATEMYFRVEDRILYDKRFNTHLEQMLKNMAGNFENIVH